jgi:hypothetical protein
MKILFYILISFIIIIWACPADDANKHVSMLTDSVSTRLFEYCRHYERSEVISNVYSSSLIRLLRTFALAMTNISHARVGLLRAFEGSGDIVEHAVRALLQSPRFARGSAGFAALRIPHAIFIFKFQISQSTNQLNQIYGTIRN